MMNEQLDINYVMNEYQNQLTAVTRELVLTKAYVKQLENKIMELSTPQEVSEQ
jgi:hypothetical protein